jgi:hypothetical protein
MDEQPKKKDRFDNAVESVVNAGSKLAGKFVDDLPRKIVKDKARADVESN